METQEHAGESVPQFYCIALVFMLGNFEGSAGSASLAAESHATSWTELSAVSRALIHTAIFSN